MPEAEPKNNQQPADLAEQPEAPVGPVPIQVSPEKAAQARTFFDRAKKIAADGNHEYAIQMLIEGLRRDPDCLQAHQDLLEHAVRRQAAGGKKAGLMATLKLKLTGGKASAQQFLGRSAPKDAKDAVDDLLDAETVWAKDPQNLSLVDIVLPKMLDAGCLESAKWLAAWLGEFNARQPKPDGQRFAMLSDIFFKLGQQDKAIDACRAAATVLPNDNQLAAMLKEMLANQTMKKGKYEETGFRQSLKDAQGQQDIRETESVTKSKHAADEKIDRARNDLAENPTEPGKVGPLVDALLLADTPESRAEAVQVLEKAYQEFGAFRFKNRAGEIRLRENRRQARAMLAEVKDSPDDAQLAEQYKKLRKDHAEQELAHFQQASKNYPTDMRLRFEVGRRFAALGRFDEAIPVLQEGQRDPRNRIRAMSLLGRCFFMKKWYSDAVDVFKKALEDPQAAAGDIAKELHYNLGRAYEAQKQNDLAVKAYSTVAQIDFLYEDVRTRLENLRSAKENESTSP